MSSFTVGVIGCGVMGRALITQASGNNAIRAISVFDVKPHHCLRRRGVTVCRDLQSLAKNAGVIIIAVKPQDIRSVLDGIKGAIKKDTLIISIAAGVTTRAIERRLRKKSKVVRVMPNMPLVIGKATQALARGNHASKADLALAKNIFASCGKVIVVRENLMDAVTAISGSGPAYFFLFLESLINAAKRIGLPREIAEELVFATAEGSIALGARQKDRLSSLIKKVASKRGTTQEALGVFRKTHFQEVITKAVLAAHRRAKELARSS
jgi:pyrroline-5-carboxylate reductase